MKDDIGEKNDLSTEFPDITAKMGKLFSSARTESEAFPPPEPGKSKAASPKGAANTAKKQRQTQADICQRRQGGIV